MSSSYEDAFARSPGDASRRQASLMAARRSMFWADGRHRAAPERPGALAPTEPEEVAEEWGVARAGDARPTHAARAAAVGQPAPQQAAGLGGARAWRTRDPGTVRAARALYAADAADEAAVNAAAFARAAGAAGGGIGEEAAAFFAAQAGYAADRRQAGRAPAGRAPGGWFA
jgi:hypothetical protein